MSVSTDRQFTVPETALNAIVRMAHESREKIGTFDTEIWRKVIENEIAKVRDNAIREANAAPREMRMKALAWDLRGDVRLGYLSLGNEGYGFSLERYESPALWYKTEYEAICRAAVAAKIEVNGKVLTEEDLK